MAYNSSKGPQQHGDVKYEGDPVDTQIDFDEIKTNGIFFPPSGGIFELRFPNDDIMVTVR